MVTKYNLVYSWGFRFRSEFAIQSYVKSYISDSLLIRSQKWSKSPFFEGGGGALDSYQMTWQRERQEEKKNKKIKRT